MRGYLATAPAGVVAATEGLFLVGWLTMWYGLPEQSNLLHTFVVATGCAAVMAAFSWSALRRDRRISRGIIGAMDRTQIREVLRAAGSGVPPEDPTLRPAAVRMAQYRLTTFVQSRTGCIVAWSVFAVLAAVLTVADGAIIFPVAAASCAAMVIWTLRYAGSQRRRIATLEIARTGHERSQRATEAWGVATDRRRTSE